MTEIIKFDRIVSVNSEVQGHGAQNILDGEIRPNKNWMCEPGTEKAVLILQLERAAVLTSIHVGNAHSAFVEVLAGRAADSADHFESLVPMSSFMNPHESKTGTNPNRTRFFTKDDFYESSSGKSWDRLKIVCTQPFNKHVRYGLCFLIVQGVAEAKKVEIPTTKADSRGEITIGSFFQKLRSSKGDKPLTASVEIKEAEKGSSLAKHSPTSAAKTREKMSSEKKTRPAKDESKEEEKKDSSKTSGNGHKKGGRTDKTPDGDKDKDKDKDKKKDKTPIRRQTKDKEESEKKERETGKRRKKEHSIDETNGKRRKKEKINRKPFEKLMEDVVLVISGFKNPLRGDIRTKALQMGAKYSSDWEPHCTHLVCAYENTPKCQQVRGKGKIVRKEWVENCHKDRKRYPWRRFALDKGDTKKAESEEEIEEGEEEAEAEEEESEEKMHCPSTSTMSSRQEEKAKSSSKATEDVGSCDEYGAVTDEDEEEEKEKVDTSDYPMPFLPDIFSQKTFFLDTSLGGRSILERYIIAYNGVLTETFDEKVDYYVTEKGGALVDVFRKKAPNVVAVKPSWIWEINGKQKMTPTTSHLVK